MSEKSSKLDLSAKTSMKVESTEKLSAKVDPDSRPKMQLEHTETENPVNNFILKLLLNNACIQNKFSAKNSKCF